MNGNLLRFFVFNLFAKYYKKKKFCVSRERFKINLIDFDYCWSFSHKRHSSYFVIFQNHPERVFNLLLYVDKTIIGNRVH